MIKMNWIWDNTKIKIICILPWKCFTLSFRHHYISTINTSIMNLSKMRSPLHNCEMIIRFNKRDNSPVISNSQSIFISSQHSPISFTAGWIDNYLFSGMLLVVMAPKAFLILKSLPFEESVLCWRGRIFVL